MLTLDEGRLAVRLAREALTAYVKEGVRRGVGEMPQVFHEKRGVFVTLHKGGDLRGCIGYPHPVLPLGQAIADSSVQAGTRDPRFPPVEEAELAGLVIEVTVLTRPIIFSGDKRRLPEEVQIGRHGLIVSLGIYSGLLLPQVATEWGFDPLDFLAQTCIKAGLPPDSWLDRDALVQLFEAQIFSEVEPSGEVVEKQLLSCQPEG